jgi:chromosome partitioning protein
VTDTLRNADGRPTGLGWPEPTIADNAEGVGTRPSGGGWPDLAAGSRVVVSRETTTSDHGWPASSTSPSALSQDPPGTAGEFAIPRTLAPPAPEAIASPEAIAGSVVVGAMVDVTSPASAPSAPHVDVLSEVVDLPPDPPPATEPADLSPHHAPLALGADVPIAEEFSVMDDVSRETEDTPIARAAESAVRVLAGRVGEPLPRPAQTRVLTVANQKGGVGKTTTTVNIAAALALQGSNVLVVDLDPQGNASTALGVDHHSEVPSVYDVLIDGRPLHEVVAPVEGISGLWCAPATIDLAGAEIELVSLVARESRLAKAIDAYHVWCTEQEANGLPRLDYVLIDCPPSLGLLTVNALVAAPEVLVPIQCEYYALEGVGQLLKNIEMIKAHLNPGLHVSTVLLTMYDARTRLAAQVAQEVRTHFATTVLRTTIPRSVRVSEAPSYGQTVMTYDPGSTGALSYLEAAREMAVKGAEDRAATGEETP